MGQAKNRGTFEERRTQAIARREDEIRRADEAADRAYAERQRRAQEWWDSLTPEEQESARAKRRLKNTAGAQAMTAAAILLGSMGAYGSPIPGRHRL